ncbi:MAG: substrate-binding domain-containing protein [Sulfurovum sp.]|nr:substrate-binding domain-containing protein [Sulfurovum sp.]
MRTIVFIFIVCFSAVQLDAKQEPALRVAVIGGMTMSGMWDKVAQAFEEAYHIRVEVAATGPKHVLDTFSRAHEVDLVTMHSSDTMVDLAADGIVEDLTPWARNSQILVGDRSNPAQIDAGDALDIAMQKLVRSHSPILIHASGGTFEVFNDVSSSYKFSPGQIHLVTTKHGFLDDVAKLKGYTFYGAIPFLMQKQYNPNMQGFTFDDKRLRRPYLAAIGTKERIGEIRYQNAQKLLMFLTSKKAQQIIQNFRIEGFSDTPVFFPVKP